MKTSIAGALLLTTLLRKSVKRWHQALVVQWINLYLADSAVHFVNTFWMDSDLPGGEHYLPFEQLGSEVKPYLWR